MIRFALIILVKANSVEVERLGLYNNIDQCNQAAEKVLKDLEIPLARYAYSCIPVYE